VAENHIDSLLKLQEIDRLIKQLSTQASDIPRRKKKISAKLDAQRIAVETAIEEHKRITLNIKEVEGDVELSEEKIKRYRRQQMEVKDNESYRALENEIRSLNRHIRRQEDSQIELMEVLETATSDLEEKQAELDRQIEDVGVEEAELDIKEEKILEKLGTHQGTASSMREGIDEDWLDRYDRIFNHKGDVALVASNNGICGGCNMAIPPALVLASKTGDSISTCNYCGRMLYYEV